MTSINVTQNPIATEQTCGNVRMIQRHGSKHALGCMARSAAGELFRVRLGRLNNHLRNNLTPATTATSLFCVHCPRSTLADDKAIRVGTSALEAGPWPLFPPRMRSKCVAISLSSVLRHIRPIPSPGATGNPPCADTGGREYCLCC